MFINKLESPESFLQLLFLIFVVLIVRLLILQIYILSEKIHSIHYNKSFIMAKLVFWLGFTKILLSSKIAILKLLGLILENYQGLFQKTRVYLRYNQKKARKSSKRAELWVFTPHFSKIRAFRTLHPPKQHVFLEFLVEKKAFHFSERAPRTGTARNMNFFSVSKYNALFSRYIYFLCFLLDQQTSKSVTSS